MRVILRGNNNQSEINIPAQCQSEQYMKVLLAILIAQHSDDDFLELAHAGHATYLK